MNPLTVPLCAFSLIFAAMQHPNRELTTLEAWTIVGNCVHIPAGVIKAWFKTHPELSNYRGTKTDREWFMHNVTGVN